MLFFDFFFFFSSRRRHTRFSRDWSSDVCSSDLEYNKYTSNLFMAEGKGYFTDAFSFDNLGAAVTRTDSSAAEESRLVSLFSRANYGFKDKFFVTGLLRYDGSTKFAAGHMWALFPGLTGSWHIS